MITALTRPCARVGRGGVVRPGKRAFALAASAAGILALECVPRAQAIAQGTVSGLGFGYPVGAASPRVAATAGSFGEFDAITPRNPGAIGGIGRAVISVNTEPEFRTVQFGGTKESSRAQRVPLIMVAIPATRGYAVGLSASTFLDRSYSTSGTATTLIDGAPVETQESSDVRGSIADLRAAVGWSPSPRFHLGIGGHLFTGDNQVVTSRVFADTTTFGNVLDSSRVVYFGTALSVGGEVRFAKGVAASASYRIGNGLDARVRDSVRTRGNVPNRLGASLRFDGIPGTLIAVGIEHQSWSRLNGLGTAAANADDALNYHAGAEVAGPRVRSSAMQLRVGYARNELPFGIAGTAARETRLSGGFGLPFAREQASIDVSLQHASRSVSGTGVREKAWLVGVGLQVRP